MSGPRPDWAVEGADWPHRADSRFVVAANLRWHVQVMGQGPVLLLLHGAGAATHSWRDLAPLLAQDFTVLAPDLPGHGFTDMPGRQGLTLPAMAAGAGALCQALDLTPAVIVGHSAGAAIAVRAVLDGHFDPRLIIALNGALEPFPGLAGHIFPSIAQCLYFNPAAIHAFAWGARDPKAAARLVRSTGSHLDARGEELYARLLRKPGHIAGTLGMMSAWDLRPLQRDLPQLSTPLLLVAGEEDLAVPPAVAEAAARHAQCAQVVRLAGLGHLAHEEQPARIAALILQTYQREAGVTAA